MGVDNRLVVVLISDRDQALHIKKIIHATDENTEVFITDKPEIAYRVIQRKTVLLMIADMELGKESGKGNPVEEFTIQLRKCERFLFLPVILLHSTDEYRERAYCEWNCVGYYNKPVSGMDFKQKVGHILAAVLPDENENSFIIRRHNVRYLVKVKELMYVRYFDRALHLYLNNEDVLKLEQRPVQTILDLASVPYIVQCSRGVLVNTMYVKGIHFRKKEICLFNGVTLKIGETYEGRIKDAWGRIDELIKRNQEEMKE